MVAHASPSTSNLAGYVGRHAVSDPARIFIKTASGQLFTYGDVDALAGRFASALRSRGVVRGDRVAVRLHKSVDLIALFIAVLRLGATYVPVNPNFTTREVMGIVEDAEPTLLIVPNGEEIDLQEQVAGHCPALAIGRDQSGFEAEVLSCEPLAEVLDGTDLAAAILYTSGTTGRPKGAILTHLNLISSLTALNAAWGITAKDDILHILPAFHAHGLLLGIGCLIVAGGGVVLVEKFEAAEAIALLPEATILMAVPDMYARLLTHAGFNVQSCSRLRLATSGSSALSLETFNAVRNQTGLSLVERYGLTETGIIASNPLNGTRKVGTVGLPLPSIDALIVDEGGNPVSRGEIGRIWVRGSPISPGYWRRPDLEGERSPGNFFDTGDLAFQDDDGYITLVGRKKDLIISGGYNVYPREVEIVIQTLDCVEEAAVFGVPHPDFGEGVVAVVKARAGADYSADAVREIASRDLVNYKRPKAVITLEDFPRNAMGKVLKTELQKQYMDLFARKKTYAD